VWIWATVGIWRSAARLGDGNKFIARLILVTASLALVPMAWSSAVAAGAMLKLVAGADPMGAPASVSVDADTMTIDGALAEGSAAAVQKVLANSRVTTFVIKSPGGRILEAEKIAALVRQFHLRTEAKNFCASACTLVLLAGDQRLIWPGSRVGFHQSTFDGNNSTDDDLATDLVRSDFRSAGVADSFIQKAFSTPSTSMWYPSEDEMISAGYLTESSLPQLLTRAAQQSLGKLPMRVDRVTILRKIDAQQSTLTYEYTLGTPLDQASSKAFENEMEKELGPKICSTPSTADLISRGATLKYDYYDHVGRLIASMAFNKCSPGA
jgi:hypothetical protein